MHWTSSTSRTVADLTGGEEAAVYHQGPRNLAPIFLHQLDASLMQQARYLQSQCQL